ncbi:MAG: hypothetical protein KDB90_13340 [Planctomycetes bacterium]|nr:hypothetical protein [Planctomycetota bacterium]
MKLLAALIVLVTCIACVEETCADSRSSDGPSGRNDAGVEHLCSHEAGKLEQAKAWLGADLLLYLMAYDDGFKGVRAAVRKLVKPASYMTLRRVFKEDVLTEIVSNWDEIAAAYLVEYVESLDSPATAPKFADVFRSAMLIMDGPAGGTEFAMAVLKMLSVVPSYRLDCAKWWAGTASLLTAESLPTIKRCVAEAATGRGWFLPALVVLQQKSGQELSEAIKKSEVTNGELQWLIEMSYFLGSSEYLDVLERNVISRLEDEEAGPDYQREESCYRMLICGRLKPIQTCVATRPENWMSWNSSHAFLDRALRRFLLADAATLWQSGAALIGEEEGPADWATRAKSFFANLTGEQLEWDSCLRCWRPGE